MRDDGSYRLTPKALADLEGIWRYSALQWSAGQADRYVDALERDFSMLAAMPEMARERMEFSPPVWIHPHGRHLIVYRTRHDHIEIVRVLGGEQDWLAILNRLD